MSVAAFDIRIPQLLLTRIVQGTGTAFVSLGTAHLAGALILEVKATNNGVASHDVEVAVLVSGVSYVVGSVAVPAAAGFAGTPPVFFSTTLVSPAVGGWLLSPTAVLQVRVTVAMGAGENMDIVAAGGPF